VGWSMILTILIFVFFRGLVDDPRNLFSFAGGSMILASFFACGLVDDPRTLQDFFADILLFLKIFQYLSFISFRCGIV
jgi:hypothetical protein